MSFSNLAALIKHNSISENSEIARIQNSNPGDSWFFRNRPGSKFESWRFQIFQKSPGFNTWIPFFEFNCVLMVQKWSREGFGPSKHKFRLDFWEIENPKWGRAAPSISQHPKRNLCYDVPNPSRDTGIQILKPGDFSKNRNRADSNFESWRFLYFQKSKCA